MESRDLVDGVGIELPLELRLKARQIVGRNPFPQPAELTQRGHARVHLDGLVRPLAPESAHETDDPFAHPLLRVCRCREAPDHAVTMHTLGNVTLSDAGRAPGLGLNGLVCRPQAFQPRWGCASHRSRPPRISGGNGRDHGLGSGDLPPQGRVAFAQPTHGAGELGDRFPPMSQLVVDLLEVRRDEGQALVARLESGALGFQVGDGRHAGAPIQIGPRGILTQFLQAGPGLPQGLAALGQGAVLVRECGERAVDSTGLGQERVDLVGIGPTEDIPGAIVDPVAVVLVTPPSGGSHQPGDGHGFGVAGQVVDGLRADVSGAGVELPGHPLRERPGSHLQKVGENRLVAQGWCGPHDPRCDPIEHQPPVQVVGVDPPGGLVVAVGGDQD